MSAPSTTAYRTLFLLACCQALLLTNSAGLVALNGLVGYQLASNKSLATLGVTTYVLGSALSTMPMSLWMAKVGRRRGFMAGALINVLGCVVAVMALKAHSFALFCAATAIIGIYNAVGLQYRFAAAEVATPADRATATSLVLAGGIVGGFLGPQMTRYGQHMFDTPFLGSFVLLAAAALVALLFQSQVDVPKPSVEERQGDMRKLGEVVRQPTFLVAALSGALGYGLMNLLMTATPLAMSFCSYPYAQAVLVIEWHVVGMYAPGFFAGNLIKRFGVLPVIGAGIVVLALGAMVALHGVSVAHFVAALVLVGMGWNFMYTGGTVLLAESHTAAEKASAQGANDFLVFAVMGVSSASSGALVASAGWTFMNWAALVVLTLTAGMVLWYARVRPTLAAAHR
ncbi:MAG: MFS transporter [Gammaproteobacteria bacterium]|nr:MFS transporter [Gammaproteobacteria bacterium]